MDAIAHEAQDRGVVFVAISKDLAKRLQEGIAFNGSIRLEYDLDHPGEAVLLLTNATTVPSDGT